MGHMPVAQTENSPEYRAGYQKIVTDSANWPTHVYNDVIRYYIQTQSLENSLDLARDLLQQDHAIHNFG